VGINYSPKIVTDNLVLCLDAANPLSYPGSGNTWTDLSANENNGALTNQTFNSNNKGSISFNGTSTTCLISASENLKTITAPLTIVAWAYQDTSAAGRCIFAQYTSTTNYRLTKMLRIDESNIKYYYGINGGSFSAITKTGNQLNQWNYYSVTVSGIPTAAYIQIGYNLDYTNLILRNNLSITPDLTTPVTIGSNGVYTEGWDGNISTVMFYNKALSQDELLQNYNATKGRFGL
jgi:hypothetical protein